MRAAVWCVFLALALVMSALPVYGQSVDHLVGVLDRAASDIAAADAWEGCCVNSDTVSLYGRDMSLLFLRYVEFRDVGADVDPPCVEGMWTGQCLYYLVGEFAFAARLDSGAYLYGRDMALLFLQFVLYRSFEDYEAEGSPCVAGALWTRGCMYHRLNEFAYAAGAGQ